MKKTRKEAKADGDIFYYTGKPCKHGHGTKRYVNGHGCSVCATEKRINRKRDWDPERYKVYLVKLAKASRKKYANDEEARRTQIERVRRWQKANPEKVREYIRRNREKNKQSD